jgi:hypothetical protein
MIREKCAQILREYEELVTCGVLVDLIYNWYIRNLRNGIALHNNSLSV